MTTVERCDSSAKQSSTYKARTKGIVNSPDESRQDDLGKSKQRDDVDNVGSRMVIVTAVRDFGGSMTCSNLRQTVPRSRIFRCIHHPKPIQPGLILLAVRFYNCFVLMQRRIVARGARANLFGVLCPG